MKTFGGWRLVSLMVMAGWSVFSRAGEAVSVSGVLEAAPTGQFFSGYFLRDPNNGGLLVGLRDPGGRLWGAAGRRVTLQAETTLTPEVNGLPILRVVSLLPEYWAQPSVWTEKQKLPGSFTSHPKGAKPKDFAGTPFTTYRAYHSDNGWEPPALGVPHGTELPAPLHLGAIHFNSDLFTGEFAAFAGLTYQVQFVNALGEAPQTISVSTPGASGPATISAPRQDGPNGFYMLRAVSLLSP